MTDLSTLPRADASGREVTEPGQEDVTKKAILLRITKHAMGVRRAVPKSLLTIDADKTLIHVGADVLVSPTLQKIKNLDASIGAYLLTKSLPSDFKKGVYLLAGKTVINKVDAWLQKKITLRKALVRQLAVELPGLIEEMKPRLKVVFTKIEYPTPDQLEAAFTFSYSYFSFDRPESLKTISTEIFKREGLKAEAWWKATLETAALDQREKANAVFDHLRKRLSGENVEGERLKYLRESAVENLKEFCRDFADLNLANDTQLEAIITRGNALLDGVDTDTLRNNTGERERVTAGLEDIKTQLDKLIEDQPTRQFNFDDADEPAQAQG